MTDRIYSIIGIGTISSIISGVVISYTNNKYVIGKMSIKKCMAVGFLLGGILGTLITDKDEELMEE